MLASRAFGRRQGSRLAAALAALVSAESRGAPEAELRLLEEGVIAARIGELRAAAHEGHAVPAAHVNQLERDLELLRRFPEDRRGDDGLGWFDWPVRGSAD